MDLRWSDADADCREWANFNQIMINLFDFCKQFFEVVDSLKLWRELRSIDNDGKLLKTGRIISTLWVTYSITIY